MRRFASAAAAAAAILMAACVPSPQPPGPATAPEPAPPAAPAEPQGAAPSAPQPWARARTPLDAYKQDIAQRVMVANAAHGFDGPPPHLLRAVIVVRMTVDRSGRITSSRILRTPGDKPLEQLALASLKRAEPLPAPPNALVSGNRVEIVETFLFRGDGRFQIRSLAPPQPDVAPEPPQASR